MNILYINHYAGSPQMGMEFRPYYLAKEWVESGHNVVIIAGDYSHLRKINPSIEVDFEEQLIDGIKYIWVKTGKYEGNGISRAFSMFRFVKKIQKNAKKLSSKWDPDVVITSSTYPLDTFAGQRIKKYSGARLIHEIHDMWPITLTEVGGMSKANPFVVLMQIAENSFCKHSDAVVSLLPCARDYLVRHGMVANKFFHVPNGIIVKEWDHPTELPREHIDSITRLKEKGSFIICFFGSHTKSYALDTLIGAVKGIDGKVAVVFIGEGSYKKELEEKTKDDDRFVFLHSIDKECIPSLFKYIDATYVGAVNNEMFRFGICMNKLFDAMMGGKPILYAVNAPNNYVEDYNCGISVVSDDIDALKDGIETMIALPKETLHHMGINGHNAAIEHFDYHNLAVSFIGIITSLMGEKN